MLSHYLQLMFQLIMNIKIQETMVLLEEEISTLPQRMKLLSVYGELKLFVSSLRYYKVVRKQDTATNHQYPKTFYYLKLLNENYCGNVMIVEYDESINGLVLIIS